MIARVREGVEDTVTYASYRYCGQQNEDEWHENCGTHYYENEGRIVVAVIDVFQLCCTS